MTNKKNQLKLMGLNYFPLLYICAGLSIVFYMGNLADQIMFILFWIYILPPLLCRIVLLTFHRPEGVFSDKDKELYIWWFLAQLQIIFNRIPFLEEILRIVPGLYSAWLNLWGSKINLTVFWSPGIHVFDRYNLNLAKGVVVGGGCRIGAHIFDKEKDGRIKLTTAPVVIKENVLLGLNSLVGPGCYIYADEKLIAGKALRPFYALKNGRSARIKT
jgi:hypothetical protein